MEDLDYIFQALAHETRRKIISLLGERGGLTFTELMKEVGIEETGTFGFHIKRLEDLISKDGNGIYRLNELGRLAYEILKYVKKESSEAERVKTIIHFDVYVVTREMLEGSEGVEFKHITTLIFRHEIDEELFKKKVLSLKHIKRIIVPRRLVKMLYSRMEKYCGSVITYEGELPSKWLDMTSEEFEKIKDIDVYGSLLLTRNRLEKYREEGIKIRIENYGKLIIDEDVDRELFDKTVHSIESFGVIYAPRDLFRIINDKIESTTGTIKPIEEYEEMMCN